MSQRHTKSISFFINIRTLPENLQKPFYLSAYYLCYKVFVVMWYEIPEKLSLLSLRPFHQHAPDSCQPPNWQLLETAIQYHKLWHGRHGRSRERQRRVQPPTKTWVFKVQWGYNSPSLFYSRTSGQHLVKPFLLEIILSIGMRSHCCTTVQGGCANTFGLWALLLYLCIFDGLKGNWSLASSKTNL